jgi:DNA primase
MTDLIQELKSRLSILDVVSRDEGEFKNGSRGKMVCAAHESLTVDTARGVWSWFSQTPGRGQKCLGGDVLSWIAYKRFGRVDVDGEQFVEVIKRGCELAGVPFPEKSEGGRHKAEGRRRIESILAKYCEVAEDARDVEFFVRAKQRKQYLSREVIERWRIGNAPSLKQCLDAGMAEDELRSVGILLKGPEEREFMFFRDSMVIPFIEGGRVVYFTSRRLVDHFPDGRPIEKGKKCLYLRSPQQGPADKGPDGGVARPAGFNLEALYHPAAKLVGIRLVEAPLDAIAATELERPAIAMLGGYPSNELCERIRKAS